MSHLHKDKQTAKYNQYYEEVRKNFMNSIKVEKKLITYLDKFVKHLKWHDELVSKYNNKAGQTNLQPKRKLISNISKSKYQKENEKEKVYLTLAFENQFRWPLKNYEEYKEKFGLQNLGDQRYSSVQTKPSLLVYYKNKFYLIDLKYDSINNKYSNLERNLLIQKTELKLDRKNHIMIQPLEYYENLFLEKDFKTIFEQVEQVRTLNYRGIQTKMNYFPMNQMFDRYNQNRKIDSYKELMEAEFQYFKQEPGKLEELFNFHCLFKQKISDLACKWHDSEKNSQFQLLNFNTKDMKFRVGLCFQAVVQDIQRQRIPSNLYIYDQFQQMSLQKDWKHVQIPTFKKLIVEGGEKQFQNKNKIYNKIRDIKEALLYSSLTNGTVFKTDKHSKLNEISNLKKNVQLKVYNHYQKEYNEKVNIQLKKIQNLKRSNYLKIFSIASIKSLANDWIKKASSQTPFLSIFMGDMYLVDRYKYTRMNCQLCIKKIGQKQSHSSNKNYKTCEYAYQFDQVTDDWNVKLSIEQKANQTKNIVFNLSDVKNYFEVIVNVSPIPIQQRKETTISIQKNERKKKIRGSFMVSKLQKLKRFGQPYELILQEWYEQDQTSVEIGFLNMFFLVKIACDQKIAKELQLENYRNIKALQNIGQIPGDYFQPTFINYNPNDLNLFAQLASFKNLAASRKNYQLIYLYIIYLLGAQKISNRRQQVIAKSGFNETSSLQSSRSYQQPNLKNKSSVSNHFSPQERYAQYKKILKIKLFKSLKRKYNNNYNYYFQENLQDAQVEEQIQQQEKSSKDREQENKRKQFLQNIQNKRTSNKLASSKSQSNKNNKQKQEDEQSSKDQQIQIVEAADKYLISRHFYFQISSADQKLSYKTFISMDENFKKSMEYSSKYLCSKCHQQTLQVLSVIFSLNQSNIQQHLISIFKTEKNSKYSSRRKIQMQQSNKNFKFMPAFNPYLVPFVNRIITMCNLQQIQNQSRKSSGLSLSNPSSSEKKNSVLNIKDTVQFTMNFFYLLYPYFNTKLLQKQQLYIRYFVQKYLPQLNFKLNQTHVGLENFVSKYLLSLFSVDLEEEITFQIWDFLILCPNKFAARINCMLTLLIFLQKTDMQSIFPLNSFVNALYENYNKFDCTNASKKVSDLMAENLGKFYQKQHQRKQQLYQIRDQNNNLLIGRNFIQKIMFDSQRLNKVNSVGNKSINLNNLDYKLPEPKYWGHPVKQIKLLLKSVFIYDTVSITQWNLIVKWQNQTSQKLTMNKKSQILNRFVKFQYPRSLKQNTYDLPHIQFLIYPESQKGNSFFFGYLPILNLHKDYVYCQQIRLVYCKDGQIQLTNKGQNVLNVQLILKSKSFKSQSFNGLEQNSLSNSKSNRQTIYDSKKSQEGNIQATLNSVNLRMQKQYYLNQQKRLDQLYDCLLDYDFYQNQNDSIKEMKNTKALFHKMKNPIDQFAGEKYENLKIPAVGDATFPEVIMKSQLLIEHFHALIYQTFPNSEEYKTKVPDLYKIFSKQTNFQMVFLTQILIQAILIDRKISFEQRIQYLYCLGKHYQNCGGKGISIQTVDFIFEYIYKMYGWLTGVSYSSLGKGYVKSGIIYANLKKAKQQGLDITNILRDWAHICKIKYGHLGLFLGNAHFLTQLRALLPASTLQELLQNDKLIRVEIIYQKNLSQYVWSAVVNPRDFKIKQMGTKFLESFPTQRQLHFGKIHHHDKSCQCLTSIRVDPKRCSQKCMDLSYQLDTSSQILYNCNNFISLQSSKSVSKQQFQSLVYKTPILSYLLNYSSMYESLETNQQYNKNHQNSNRLRNSQMIKNGQNQKQQNMKQSSQYKGWILYRYQNCLEKWKSCRLKNIQDGIAEVQFPQQSLEVQNQIIRILNHQYSIYRINTKPTYKAPEFEVWSMEQNLIDENQEIKDQKGKKKNDNFKEFINRMQKQNQKLKMNAISSDYLSSHEKIKRKKQMQKQKQKPK